MTRHDLETVSPIPTTKVRQEAVRRGRRLLPKVMLDVPAILVDARRAAAGAAGSVSRSTVR